MFLNRIRYKYVPAIKSDDFSARLLGELYLCVSAEENSDFRKRMDDYANALQQYTQSISTEIKAKIGMDSKIIRSTRPTADFFSSLIFNTASEGFDVLLQQRGDGIKARHIPAILKFISAHQPKEQHQKAPYTTIWGYEEPETALELSQCFEFANEFVAYSKNIQVFLTSHSPAFYMICASEKKQGKRFYVNRTNNTTSISETEESSILAAIAPYFAEIQRLNAEIGKAKKPLLFVEGDYDIRYLKKAAELLDRNGPLDSFQMVDSEGYGNIEKVAKHFDSKLAFVTPQIIVLLYDCDIKKTENEKGNIFIRVMQTVNTNPLKKGIENLFAKDLLDKAIQHKPAFIDVTQATTKTVRGQEEEVPETWEANKDEKKNLCDWIIANGTKEDFQSFNRVFDILQNILE